MTKDRASTPVRVACLGELVVDFIKLPGDLPLEVQQAATLAGATIGGGPLNVATGLAAQGMEVHLVSRVGNDLAGTWLKQQLASLGLSSELVQTDPEKPTRHVVMHQDASGGRRVHIPERDSAERYLVLDVATRQKVLEAGVLHITGPAVLGKVAHQSIKSLVDEAKRAGVFISFDANIPPHHLPPAVRERLLYYMRQANLLKLDEQEAADWLGSDWRHQVEGRLLVAVTRGAKGAFLISGSNEVEIPAVSVPWVDATGAGDAFWSVCLGGWVQNGCENIERNELKKLGAAAATHAAKIIQHRGGVTAYQHQHRSSTG